MSDPIDIRKGHEFYQRLGVDPFASDKEISSILANQSDALASLPDDQKAARIQELQKVAQIVKDKAKRVQLNALLPERIDEKTIASFLSKIDALEQSDLAPPPPSIADVYTEGASRDLMGAALDPPEIIDDLELDFDTINTILSTSLKDREIYFDS